MQVPTPLASLFFCKNLIIMKNEKSLPILKPVLPWFENSNKDFFQNKIERGFKGVWFPASLWLNESLSLQEKAFYIEIDSLNGLNGCTAGNEHFAKIFSLTKNRVSAIITGMNKRGLISVKLEYKSGTKEIEKRIMKPLKNKILIADNIELIAENEALKAEIEILKKAASKTPTQPEATPKAPKAPKQPTNDQLTVLNYYNEQKQLYFKTSHVVKFMEAKTKLNAALKVFTVEELKQVIEYKLQSRQSQRSEAGYKATYYTIQSIITVKNVSRILEEINSLEEINNWQMLTAEPSKNVTEAIAETYKKYVSLIKTQNKPLFAETKILTLNQFAAMKTKGTELHEKTLGLIGPHEFVKIYNAAHKSYLNRSQGTRHLNLIEYITTLVERSTWNTKQNQPQEPIYTRPEAY